MKRVALLLAGLAAIAGCAEISRDAARSNLALNRGVEAQLAGRSMEAEGHYLEVLEIGASVVASYNLGVLAQVSGDRAEASARYRQALAIDPEYSPALYNLGVIAIESERYEEAVRLYQRFVGLSPDGAGGHWNLAEALEALGRTADADAERAIAIALDPAFAGNASGVP